MPASFIEDDGEVRRWFEEDRPYSYMIEQYQKKYNKKTTPAYWSKQRQRRGFDRRNVRDTNLIPWRVRNIDEHQHSFTAHNLRAEARRRAGKPIPADKEAELDVWIKGLREDDAVIHYDPDTAEGWHRVPRRHGIDLDLIREPEERFRTGSRNLDEVDLDAG